MNLIASLRRVLAWKLHEAGHWLDPLDSYHVPLRDPDQDDEAWVLSLIRDGQPMPWASLVKWSALPIQRLRDVCTDLSEAGVITPTLKGFIVIGQRERTGS